MKFIRHIYCLIATVIAICACSVENLVPEVSGNEVFTFHPSIDGGIMTRAIGDASHIDRIEVRVFEDGSEGLSPIMTANGSWEEIRSEGLQLTLVDGKTYKILFWAENGGNSTYEIGDDGCISASYEDHLTGGFAKMEELDAFYAVSSITPGAQTSRSQQVTLTRPLAQLNFADKDMKPQSGLHQAVVTLHGIPTGFNPFSGEVFTTDNEDITFTFNDFPTETLDADGVPYNYVSSNYLLAPENGTVSISVTLDMQEAGGASLNVIEFKGERSIILEKNKKTNILGTIVQKPSKWSTWDGTIPSVCPLHQEQGCYIIDEAADLAWLSVSTNAEDLSRRRLQPDHDRRHRHGRSWRHVIDRPAGRMFVERKRKDRQGAEDGRRTLCRCNGAFRKRHDH